MALKMSVKPHVLAGSMMNLTKMQEVEVVYTWEMDFNRSVLGASTLLVPRTTAATAPAPGMPAWAHTSWICVFAAMLVVAIGGNAIVIWIVTVDECSSEEVYDECSAHCEYTCDNFDGNRACTNICEPGCICREGLFRRYDGECVLLVECGI